MEHLPSWKSVRFQGGQRNKALIVTSKSHRLKPPEIVWKLGFHWVHATMSTITIKQTAPSLSDQVALPGTTELHALSAGHLTLPEKFFVHPASNSSRRTVPSLAFLIQHHHPITGKITRIVFDLGLRREVQRYSEAIQRHVSTRQPLTTDPDVVKSLAAGGLSADDIDYIIYSHVWRQYFYTFFFFQ
jgi:hypothetical protein